MKNNRNTRWLLIVSALIVVVVGTILGLLFFSQDVFHPSPGTVAKETPTAYNSGPGSNAPCTFDSPYGFTTINADPQLVTTYKQLDVCWVRYQVHWNTIEKTPGVYDWSQVDQAISLMNRANIHVDFAIQSAPAWRKTQLCYGVPYLPGPNEMAQFATIIATRYDGKHGHGQVDSFEIGNEEYDQHYAGSMAASESCRSAKNYGPVLKAGYQVIKAVNPNALVGMFGQWLHDISHIRTFMNDLFAMGYGRYMDYMNFHFYNDGQDPTVSHGQIPSFDLWWQTMHEAAAHYGYADKPIWVTEVGWATHSGYRTSRIVTPDQQMNYLQYIMSESEKSGVIQKVFWFTINYGKQADSIDPPSGPLPAFSALQAIIRQKSTWN